MATSTVVRTVFISVSLLCMSNALAMEGETSPLMASASSSRHSTKFVRELPDEHQLLEKIERGTLTPEQLAQTKYQLACLYCDRDETDLKLGQARVLLNEAIESYWLTEAELANAQIQLARLYKNKKGGEFNRERAQELFDTARARLQGIVGNRHLPRNLRTNAQYLLACSMIDGDTSDSADVCALLDTAISSRRLTAQQQADAQFRLAGCYGCREDLAYKEIKKQIRLLRAAVASDQLPPKRLAHAQLELGTRLEQLYCDSDMTSNAMAYCCCWVCYGSDFSEADTRNFAKVRAYLSLGRRTILPEARHLLEKAIENGHLSVVGERNAHAELGKIAEHETDAGQ